MVDEEGFIRNWLILGAILWENDTTHLMADQLHPKANPDNRLPVQETNSKDLTPKIATLVPDWHPIRSGHCILTIIVVSIWIESMGKREGWLTLQPGLNLSRSGR